MDRSDSVGHPVFVTLWLSGSLPRERVFPPASPVLEEAFRAVDKLLNQCRAGLHFLKQPEIAQIIVTAIREGDTKFRRYQLHSYVVMPNHVHLLVTPNVPNAIWLGPLKAFTEFTANRILSRTGGFWQEASYDYLVGDGEEFRSVRRYIEDNPVAAGLCARPVDFLWSSAAP
jgi:REP element-mobilizing transposase RayT